MLEVPLIPVIECHDDPRIYKIKHFANAETLLIPWLSKVNVKFETMTIVTSVNKGSRFIEGRMK